MAYLIDANVFIAAKNLHYGFEFCPAFWDWIKEAHAAGKLFSVESVGDELVSADDELAEWTSGLGDEFFLAPGSSTIDALGKVSEWATSGEYEPSAINTFLGVADYFLVAHALAEKHTVVTHERSSTSVKKIKIPNACLGLDVAYATPFQMLQREKARFVLAAR